jgi:hypothetical protein
MTIAYETGTALHANDLLDRLRLFAAANGWTVNRWAVRSDAGGSGGWALNLQRGADLHALLYADLDAGGSDNPGQYVGGALYPAWDAALGNMAQANRSALIFTNGLGTAQYTGYHFFTSLVGDAPYLHAVVEVISGEFRHFGCGRILRLGAVASGAYVHMSAWNYSVWTRSDPLHANHGVPWDSRYSVAHSGSMLLRADSDAVSPRYLVAGATLTDGLYCGLRGGSPIMPDTLPAQQAAASTITGRAPLWPITAAARRGGTGLYSPLGQPPHLRWVRLDHLQPKDVITLGIEQWMVFPVIRRQGGAGQPNSGLMGMAYRRA